MWSCITDILYVYYVLVKLWLKEKLFAKKTQNVEMSDYTRQTLFCPPSPRGNPPPPIHVHVLAVYVTVAAGTRPGSGVTSQATGKVPWLVLLCEQ